MDDNFMNIISKVFLKIRIISKILINTASLYYPIRI